MKNYKYIIISLSVTVVLLLGIIIGKEYFSSEAREKQAEMEYQKKAMQLEHQQNEEAHRRMEAASKNLNSFR